MALIITTIASLVVALVASITLILKIREMKKNILVWSYVITPLLNADIKSIRVQHQIKGADETFVYKNINNPHLVEINIAKEGKDNIKKDDFEGYYLPIHLGVPVIIFINQMRSSNTQGLKFLLKDGNLYIPPCQIKTGHTLKGTFLCDGKPSPEMGEISSVDTMLADDPRIPGARILKFKKQLSDSFWVFIFLLFLSITGGAILLFIYWIWNSVLT